jgi:uncharacterized C2H2 Zn-finger protein
MIEELKDICIEFNSNSKDIRLETCRCPKCNKVFLHNTNRYAYIRNLENMILEGVLENPENTE